MAPHIQCCDSGQSTEMEVDAKTWGNGTVLGQTEWRTSTCQESQIVNEDDHHKDDAHIDVCGQEHDVTREREENTLMNAITDTEDDQHATFEDLDAQEEERQCVP